MKRIERDSDGQNNVEVTNGQRAAQHRGKRGRAFHREIRVLEKAKQEQVDRYRNGQDALALLLGRSIAKKQSASRIPD